MKKPPNSWQQFIATAKNECSQIAYQNWLEPIQLESITNEQITLTIPNIYVKEYLLEHFSELMSQFFPIESLAFSIDKPKETEKEKTTVAKKNVEADLKLHPGYRFENFIEGIDNQFVKSCAQKVAKNPMQSFNPFFIYGDAGLGKTHLLHAIAHHLKSQKKYKIQCITMEGFINELVHHLNQKSMAQMKKAYRNLDVLLIDDIQFLEKRPNFAEEFCNTIEHLISQNKQICIVSDKPPNQLKIDPRITNRLEMGLSCKVVAPNFETKVAILQHKLLKANVQIPEEMICYIAAKPFNNIRQLEGVVYRLKAYASLNYPFHSEIQVDKLLHDLVPTIEQKPVQLHQVVQVVSKAFHLETEQMLSSSRSQHVASARQCAIYLAKELCHLPLTQIASFFGRTHSTLLHSYKNVENRLQKEPTLKETLEKLKESLYR